MAEQRTTEDHQNGEVLLSQEDERVLKEQEALKEYEEALSERNNLQIQSANLHRQLAESRTAYDRLLRQQQKTAAAITDWHQMISESMVRQRTDYTATAKPVRDLASAANALIQTTESLETMLTASHTVNLAASEMTYLTMQYTDSFQKYRETRRIVEGCVRVIDQSIPFVRDPAKYLEKAYLECSDYWLAAAACAVIFRDSALKAGPNEVERTEWERKADRMEHLALLNDPENSQIFFILTDLNQGRITEAQERGLSFLTDLQDQELTFSFQFILQAYLHGSLGENPILQEHLRDCYHNLENRAQDIDPSWPERIVSRTREYAEHYAVPDIEHFALIREYCPSCYPQMRKVLHMARRNKVIFQYMEKALLRSETENSGENDLLQALVNLIRQKTPEEQALYREIERCGAIIRTDGDIQEAKRWVAQKEKSRGNAAPLLPDLLLHWALDEDQIETDPVIQQFSIAKLSALLSDGFQEYADLYKKIHTDLFYGESGGCLIEISGWRGRYHPFNKNSLTASLHNHFLRGLPRRAISDPYTFLCLGAIVVSLIVLVIAAKRHELFPLLASILIAAIATTGLTLRARGLRANLDDEYVADVKMLEAIQGQIDSWENEYREADLWNERLADLLTDYGEIADWML